MTGPSDAPPVVNGWRLHAHSLFLEQLEALIGEVERARRRDPERFVRSNVAKRLAAITKLAFEAPTRPHEGGVSAGDTLGGESTRWFRATFFQQFWLFFRNSSDDRTITYVWVDDERRRRAYGSRTDAYRVFRRMLAVGDPAGSWDHLVSHATGSTRRLRRVASPDDPDA